MANDDVVTLLLMRLYRHWPSAILMLAASLFAAAPVRAANLPVFRQALELWPASIYEIVVFHRGEMDNTSQSLVDQLRVAPGQVFANIDVKTVDVSGQMESSMLDLWTCQTNPLPPWLVVRAPGDSADASPVWSGHLTPAMLGTLLDSPARQKIAENLLKGVTAVWILLESGEVSRDEAAVDVLSAELKQLQKTMHAPKPADGDPKMRSPLPLDIEFGLVRITRTDPAEEFLVTLLQHGKQIYANRPAAFAVYGRGRMLGALVGREIEPEAIDSVCASIVAAWSPESKEQNPGRDLLLAADWNSIFNPAARKKSAPPPAPASVATVVSPPSGHDSAGSSSRQWSPYIVVALLAGGLVAFLSANRRRQRPPDGGSSKGSSNGSAGSSSS